MTTRTVSNAVERGTYVVDPVHSSVTFAVRHNGVSTFRSGFKAFDAHLTGGESPRLEGTVDVTSIDVPDEQLRGHLLSPEFFDAERHSKLSFHSSELSVSEQGELRIRGELEIRDHLHEVEAAGRLAQLGEDIAGGRRVGLSLEATVDRRGFGLDWNAELPSGGQVLDYDVQIAVELQLVEEAG
jgi:polyisoprenoid-binding protein YceI